MSKPRDIALASAPLKKVKYKYMNYCNIIQIYINVDMDIDNL